MKAYRIAVVMLLLTLADGVVSAADDSITIQNDTLWVLGDSYTDLANDIASPAETFEINGKTIAVKTGSDGVARILIGETPGKYTLTTQFNAVTYKNTITVRHVLKAKKTSRKFALKATLKINGKLKKGKTVKFKLNGKTYKVKTDKLGVAKKTLKRNVIKKLKKGKKYTVSVSYLKDTVKTTLRVRQVEKSDSL